MRPQRTIRAAWALALLVMPNRVVVAAGGQASPGVMAAARVLGARHLLEVLILNAEHDRQPPGWLIAVDATHALSMLALAGVSRRLRRDALLSAAGAAALIALSVVERVS